ncbi:MAG TPA: DUF3152 domain-containing protein [Dermatophilaceae bacterium]|nr:DUF3152 domain-containing protein [Dermatophilaceae bacterium]
MPTRDTRLARRRMYRRRRMVAAGGLLACCALLVLAGFRVAGALPHRQGPESAGSASVSVLGSALAQGRQASPSPTSPTSPPSAATSAPARSPSASPTSTVSQGAAPVRATGVYARAAGGTAQKGPGTARTYRVEVETGIAQRAGDFAAEVDATLASPSSWSGKGQWSLQRVTGDADFVIRLATPATVDRVCAGAGLDTRGYVSCRAGTYVMINLDRWTHAVPDYRGDVSLYRQYVINHEVGHQLGYGHQACPRKGALAPVMQQQTFGLDGCRANGWPYVDGVMVTGPATS